MTSNKAPEYSGLMGIPGVRSTSYPSSQAIACPFCANADVVHLTGKITFGAKISGNDLFDGEPQPLAAFICPRSHVFFLRESDIFRVESRRSTA